MEFASDFNYSAPYSLKLSANETRTDAIEQAFHTLAHLSVELSKRLVCSAKFLVLLRDFCSFLLPLFSIPKVVLGRENEKIL